MGKCSACAGVYSYFITSPIGFAALQLTLKFLLLNILSPLPGSSLDTIDNNSLDGMPHASPRHDPLHDSVDYDPKSPSYIIPDDLIKHSQEEFKNYSSEIKCETDTRPSVIETSAHHAIECT